jgi:hypothetical protein
MGRISIDQIYHHVKLLRPLLDDDKQTLEKRKHCKQL